MTTVIIETNFISQIFLKNECFPVFSLPLFFCFLFYITFFIFSLFCPHLPRQTEPPPTVFCIFEQSSKVHPGVSAPFSRLL